MTHSTSNATVWHYKPWWCQPWSIVLTGLAGIGGSWIVLQWLWLTVLISGLVSLWWIVFLWFYPRAAAASGLLETLASPSSSIDNSGVGTVTETDITYSSE